MSDIAIRVTGLGKQYRIGSGNRSPYRSLRESISKGFRSLFRRQETAAPPDGETLFWALRDVSFEVRRGEAVGVIGRNGAGKSTLLKILSRITEPTTGRVELHGRVGSLLEVGTGFHPELTGRENIFLNGAILGMRRAEIARKFDEIVAFAEIERFLDTPVRFYSSGMYMRLAFAIAAHLEPEILIVDEVLAVGDSGFQKKCLGKTENIVQRGRTVLFVSHSMQAVRRLTTSCLVLSDGNVVYNGHTAGAIREYEQLQRLATDTSPGYIASPPPRHSHVAQASVITSAPYGRHDWGRPLVFRFTLRLDEPSRHFAFSFQILDDQERPVVHCHYVNPVTKADYDFGPLERGAYQIECRLPQPRLYLGSYTVTTWLANRRSNQLVEKLSGILAFEVSMLEQPRAEYERQVGDAAYVEDFIWSLTTPAEAAI
ncbi:MAG: ABC transporter [Chloracidobacterium sp. CP2_5A]|nr:MAG: ABC transporter [Chloracidobacterium sp. CP2_5A]